MAKNYQQDGFTLDYLNSGTSNISSGDPVAVGEIVGVAHDDIPAGLWGTLHTAGVFILPKSSEIMLVGQKLYLAQGKLTGTEQDEEGAENPFAGTAWRSASTEDDEIAVRLGY